MTILDVNLLIYASDSRTAQHHAALPWLRTLFRSSEEVGLPWPSLWGFLRITTDPRLRERARTPANALDQVHGWLAEPGVSAIQPGPRHFDILEHLMRNYQVSGSRVSDAVLAALAIEHGATLASTDRDFSRFPNLKWVNPLDAA